MRKDILSRANKALEVRNISIRAKAPASNPGLVASARRLKDHDIRGKNSSAQGSAMPRSVGWQQEAWELLDLIGELRFLAHTLAGRMAQAALYVGKVDEHTRPGIAPDHAEEPEVQQLLELIGDGIAGQSRIISRSGVNLFVSGECWLVGIPPALLGDEQSEPIGAKDFREIMSGNVNILDLEWHLLSSEEVTITNGGTVELTLEDQTVEAYADDIYMIRIWREHPRKASEADSPTRASLPVMRELVGLTQHISAQIDSRLAGAGIIFMPTEASDALKRQAGLDEDSAEDPFMEALTLAMETPITDRASAAAIVPLTVTLPQETISSIRYMSFSTPLDGEARQLRDEAIRRLALGLDAPPELLLGTGGMNHWGAWLVQEEVVNTHLEPPLSIICDALTTQYLRPVLMSMGYSAEEASKYVVWYSVDHLISRPNKPKDAKDLHTQGILSDEAVRRYHGFEETDAPAETSQDEAVLMAVDMIARAPSLAESPGLDELVASLRRYLGGEGEDTGPAAPRAADQQPAPSKGINESKTLPDIDNSMEEVPLESER